MQGHGVMFADDVVSGLDILVKSGGAVGHGVPARSEKETARMAAVGERITGIAHCVKNMLNGLQCGVFVAKRELNAAGAECSGHGIEILEKNLGRLQELVLDMLMFAKDRAPEFAGVDINELVGTTVDLMRMQARQRHVCLRFRGCEGLEAVEIDPRGMQRCVLDLVSNALDACESPGAGVDVSVLSGGPHHVVIEVTDQGCGMDAETMRSIFQPFFSTKSSCGTGMGLAMTRKIVQEHGGGVEVDSAPGRGSRFRIRLPRRRCEPWALRV